MAEKKLFGVSAKPKRWGPLCMWIRGVEYAKTMDVAIDKARRYQKKNPKWKCKIVDVTDDRFFPKTVIDSRQLERILKKRL